MFATIMYLYMNVPYLATIPPKKPVLSVNQISRFESKAVKTLSLLKNRPHFRL